MRILDLLSEGVLKVPKDILIEMQKTALNYTLSAVGEDVGNDLELNVVIKRDFPDFTPVKTNWPSTTTYEVNATNIPSGYAKKLREPFTVTLVVARSGNTEGGGGEFDSETNTILLDIEGLYYYQRAVDAPGEFTKKLAAEVTSSVEHELMHAIQHNVIGIDVGMKAAEYVGKGSEVYHNADIEIDPLVVTYVGGFLSNTRPQVLQDYQQLKPAMLKYMKRWKFFTDLNPENKKKVKKKFHDLVLQRLK